MASAVQSLQNGVLNGSKSLTQLLREAKVIAAKLNLEEVERWVDLELNGYPDESNPPEYREYSFTHVEFRNPYHGWMYGFNYTKPIKAYQPISEIERMAKADDLMMPLQKNIPVKQPIVAQFPQRIVGHGDAFKPIVEAVKNELLKWTVELQRRGIEGDEMKFDEREKQAAASQTIHIGNIGSFNGVVGNASNSPVTLYEYSSVYQLLKDKGVPQPERNELENLMDELKAAPEEKKPTLIQRGKDWIVRNKDFLGAGTEIVARALGAS